MEHDLPILVFNYKREGNIVRAVSGERVGTLIASRFPLQARNTAATV